MRRKSLPKLLYADAKGNIFDHQHLTMAGMSGAETVLPEAVELIPLPDDSRLFTIPDTPPVAWDGKKRVFVTVDTVRDGKRRDKGATVSAFMAPGYVRTCSRLRLRRKEVHLPLVVHRRGVG